MKATSTPTARHRAALVALAAFSALPAAGLSAREAGASTGATPIRQLAPVEIKRAKNPGDLPYTHFLESQTRLQSYLPPEPRVIDMRLRLSFTGIAGPARDDYLPDTWAVAIVGDTVDHTIAVNRGGYFVLPDLPEAARENATIMFNTQTRKNQLKVAWKLRIGEGQVLSYADFSRAFDEVKAVQDKIPVYRISMRDERTARFDGLRACFVAVAGRIEVDGRPAATSAEGSCQVLKFDPALAGAGEARIAFIGALDTVTLNETGG